MGNIAHCGIEAATDLHHLFGKPEQIGCGPRNRIGESEPIGTRGPVATSTNSLYLFGRRHGRVNSSASHGTNCDSDAGRNDLHLHPPIPQPRCPPVPTCTKASWPHRHMAVPIPSLIAFPVSDLP